MTTHTIIGGRKVYIPLGVCACAISRATSIRIRKLCCAGGNELNALARIYNVKLQARAGHGFVLLLRSIVWPAR